MADKPMGFGIPTYKESDRIFGGPFGFGVPEFTVNNPVFGVEMGFGVKPERLNDKMYGKPFEGQSTSVESSVNGNNTQNSEIIDGIARLILELGTGIIKVIGFAKNEIETYRLAQNEQPAGMAKIPQTICREEQPAVARDIIELRETFVKKPSFAYSRRGA